MYNIHIIICIIVYVLDNQDFRFVEADRRSVTLRGGGGGVGTSVTLCDVGGGVGRALRVDA